MVKTRGCSLPIPTRDHQPFRGDDTSNNSLNMIIDMKHHFYNKNTQFDPNYRNIQSELWTLLSDEQRAIIGGIFKHLKNHAQIEIASAIIDYIESDYEDIPSVYAWSDITVGALFHIILNRAFDVEIDELFPELNKKGGRK